MCDRSFTLSLTTRFMVYYWIKCALNADKEYHVKSIMGKNYKPANKCGEMLKTHVTGFAKIDLMGTTEIHFCA